MEMVTFEINMNELVLRIIRKLMLKSLLKHCLLSLT